MSSCPQVRLYEVTSGARVSQRYNKNAVEVEVEVSVNDKDNVSAAYQPLDNATPTRTGCPRLRVRGKCGGRSRTDPLACGRVVEQVASDEGDSPTKQEKVGGPTFVAPDLLYALSRVGVELSDDIGEAILCVVKEGLEVVVLCGGGVGDHVLEAGWGRPR